MSIKPDSLVYSTSRPLQYGDMKDMGSHAVYHYQGRVIVVPLDTAMKGPKAADEVRLENIAIFINDTGEVAKNRFGKTADDRYRSPYTY